MKIIEINPHIRYAEQIIYSQSKNTVYVHDCRLFYIIDGEADIEIDSQNIHLCKNSVFYCRGKKSYSIDAESPLTLIALNFDLTQSKSNYVSPFIPLSIADCKDVNYTNECEIDDCIFLNSFLFIKNGIEFKSTFEYIIKEYSSRKLMFREKCSCVLSRLLIDMHVKSTEQNTNASDIIDKVTEYIAQNYNNDIKNSELASFAGYHENHLNRLFIKHTSTTIHKYIINLRLNEAKRLLLNTNLSLAEIASRTGFNSNTHFSNYFKRTFNMSPSEYRTNFKNKI